MEKLDEVLKVLGHPLIILIAGDPKTGKTVSSCTFPKPMKFFDFDGGIASTIFVDKKMMEGIDVVNVHYGGGNTIDLTAEDSAKSIPTYMENAVKVYKLFNEELSNIGKDGKVYETVVIDSLTSMFRVLRDAYIHINTIVPPRLRIQDYGTMHSIVFSRLFPVLRALPVKFVVLVAHLDMDKDEVMGNIIEYPSAPSKNIGRAIGKECDEVWRQVTQGNEYLWKTRGFRFMQGGSRLRLPDTIKATFDSLKKVLEME